MGILCPDSRLVGQIHTYHNKMDVANKADFDFFMVRALANTADDCYIELYNILLRAFVTADVDFDGKVSVEEFDGMIEAAAALPRKFGYKWWSEEKCPDEAASIIPSNSSTETLPS